MNTRQRLDLGPLHGMVSPVEEQVLLVDGEDNEIGVGLKGRVHATGELHRAVSVFLFDGLGRLLLQRRAASKYHSPGLWSNTCCGHPRPGESTDAAARRRLREEMGVDCALLPAFAFTYRADLGGGLIEHEIDHVFTGTFSGTPVPNPGEVDGWGWMPMADLRADCRRNPARYSAWLPTALDQFAVVNR